eukprot:6174421-Pleurochrysis_carterae.AAC.1
MSVGKSGEARTRANPRVQKGALSGASVRWPVKDCVGSSSLRWECEVTLRVRPSSDLEMQGTSMSEPGGLQASESDLR